MTIKVESSEALTGLSPEAQALLQELRKNYRRHKKGRVTMAARKRGVLFAGGVIFSVVTGLVAIMQLAGLLF